MNENRSFASSFWRIVLPLALVAVVLVATILVSGTALIRIEDITINRILAGTYGTPDWRVQEMNPLLAQFLTLLYHIIPSINWYGVLLLSLLLFSAAAAIGLAARKKGGLIPAAVVVLPIVLLLTYTIQSTSVAALAAAAGSLLLMDGLHRRKQGHGRAVSGGLLFLFAAMLSFYIAILVAAAAALCWLPCALRESRVKALLFGIASMAVLSLALFGYSTLMYNTPDLSAYRSNYTQYVRLQHSSLKDEAQTLLSKYGTALSGEGHEDHSHETEDEALACETVIEPNSFDAVGWTINEASLFFSRYAMDAKLTNPETLLTLSEEATFMDFSPGRLLSNLINTLKKPQFLLLIGLLTISALTVVITSRRKGLVALLAAAFALCGHIVCLASYYDAFADIAPFYLLSLVALLYHFDAEDAKAWYHRVLASRILRLGAMCALLLGFAGIMTGLFYYTGKTPANSSPYAKIAVDFIKAYTTSQTDMLFIGDNPNDRYYPNTLTAPVRGEDQNLLAGSYDLYSPRAAALMAQYGLENPLTDFLNREDTGYISMSFFDRIYLQLVDAHDLYLKPQEELVSNEDYSEKILKLSTYTQAELDDLIAQEQFEQEQAALWEEALKALEAQGLLPEDDHDHDDHDHDHEDETPVDEAPVEEAAPDA